MSAQQIHHLIELYGCAVVFAAAALQALGPPVPATTVLVAAAVYAAATHGLPIAGLILAGSGGALIGTVLAFLIGRRGGAPLLHWVGRHLRQTPGRVERLRADFANHGAAWIFLGRFITGVRNVTGLVAGASGMAAGRFILISAAAATAWAALNALEYYWFGRALAGASTWLQALLIGVGLVWMLISLRFLRRRAARRLAGAPDWQPDTGSA